jgi:hypothetical protein
MIVIRANNPKETLQKIIDYIENEIHRYERFARTTHFRHEANVSKTSAKTLVLLNIELKSATIINKSER